MRPSTIGDESPAVCIARQYKHSMCEREVADAKRLQSLEAENAKMKKMLTEQMMDVAMPKEMLEKNF